MLLFPMLERLKMDNRIAIWKCKEHGEFKTKTKGRPKCPVCKSVKLTYIRDVKPINFICCNCRAEFQIEEFLKSFNCPDCDAIFEKNEDGGYIEQ